MRFIVIPLYVETYKETNIDFSRILWWIESLKENDRMLNVPLNDVIVCLNNACFYIAAC